MSEGTKSSESTKFDPSFKYEIIAQPGGANLLRCYQCSTCSGICPIFEVDGSYDPQRILKMALLGMRTEVLSSEMIWLCSTCYMCYEHCPQDVKFTDVMCAIQNLATKYGYLAPALPEKIKLLKEHARTLPMDVFDNKKRAKFNLPEITEEPEHTARIIERTGIEDIVAAAPKPKPAGMEEHGEGAKEGEGNQKEAVH